MGLFGSNHIVGIDFGFATIKVVGLTAGKRPRVIGFGEVSVDAGSLQKEGESPEKAGEALREALKLAQPRAIKASDAYLSVSEASIFRKVIEVPRSVTEAELPSVVRAAVIEFLPEDIENLELDFQPLPISKDSETQSMMVVAVSRKLIDQYLAICKAAGLTVRAIDPKPSALLRSVVGPKSKVPMVIVDIGSETSSVSLCAEGAVWVASTVTQGGNIVKDIVTGGVDEDKKQEKLGRLVASLADEIDHVTKFYANRSTSTVEVTEVRLTGGGTLIEGLEAVFASESGYKVVMAKPPVEMPSGFDRRYMGALGSALYPWYEVL